MPTSEQAEVAAHEAYGMASEAIAAVRSNEKITNLNFKHYDETVKDIRELLHQLDKKVDQGFKAYDNKFWSLAVVLILTLLGICGFLLVYTLFPGHHG